MSVLGDARLLIQTKTSGHWSHLEPADDPVVIQGALVVVPGLASVQVEGVQPVLKVTILILQLLVVHLEQQQHRQPVHNSICSLLMLKHNG